MKNAILLEDIKLINSLCLFENEPFGVLDENRLLSALGNQYQPYPNYELAFASVYKSLVINHGFMNGNKRTAVISLYLASKMIGNELITDDKQLAKLTYQIADDGGAEIPVEQIAKEVFKNFSTNSELHEITDVAKTVKTFVKEHEWLMKELGK